MKFFALSTIITIAIFMINDSIAINNDAIEVVEIAMDDLKPTKCLNADYRGFIVEEIVSRYNCYDVALRSFIPSCIYY